MNVQRKFTPPPVAAKTPTSITFTDIPVGLPFRYGYPTAGPYLKVRGTRNVSTSFLLLEISTNQLYDIQPDYVFNNYAPLLNAVLITNEE